MRAPQKRQPKAPAFGPFEHTRPAALGPAPTVKYKRRRNAPIKSNP